MLTPVTRIQQHLIHNTNLVHSTFLQDTQQYTAQGVYIISRYMDICGRSYSDFILYKFKLTTLKYLIL